jgi:hypothetical protein
VDEENAAQAGEQAGAPDATGELREELRRTVGRYRELLVAAHPDAVPELIRGADIAELDASLGPAKAAYARARESARAELAAAPRGANPPRRSAPPAGLEAAGPLAKIKWGLREKG